MAAERRSSTMYMGLDRLCVVCVGVVVWWCVGVDVFVGVCRYECGRVCGFGCGVLGLGLGVCLRMCVCGCELLK